MDSFIFLIKSKACDIFLMDDLYRKPRNVALIYSAFYKVLYKLEKDHSRSLSYNNTISPIDGGKQPSAMVEFF